MREVRGMRGDFGRLEALLAEMGLRMPPMPADADVRLKERDTWCFSTRALKVSASDLAHHARKAIGGASPDYVLVAQASQGLPRNALHYFLLQGPLQIFLQLGWAEAPAEHARATGLVNDCFALAEQLVAAVARALHAGRLARAGRLTVVASDLSECFWEVAAPGVHASQPGRSPRGKGRDVRGPREVLAEAVAWCRGTAQVLKTT
jgi:hypothetical protein